MLPVTLFHCAFYCKHFLEWIMQPDTISACRTRVRKCRPHAICGSSCITGAGFLPTTWERASSINACFRMYASHRRPTDIYKPCRFEANRAPTVSIRLSHKKKRKKVSANRIIILLRSSSQVRAIASSLVQYRLRRSDTICGKPGGCDNDYAADIANFAVRHMLHCSCRQS